MNDVPWDQALDFILKSKGLAKREAGNVILVAPTAEILKLEEEELKSQEMAERLEPLKTEYIQVNYAKAENFRNILFGMSSISADGCTISQGASSSGGQGGGKWYWRRRYGAG